MANGMRHRQQAYAREDKRMARVITKCGQIHSHSESCLRHEDCSFPPHLHSRICLLQTKGIATQLGKNKVILIVQCEGWQCPYMRHLHRLGDGHRRVPDQRHHRGPNRPVC